MLIVADEPEPPETEATAEETEHVESEVSEETEATEETSEVPVEEPEAEAPTEEPETAEPETPAGPKVGQQVGFIDLGGMPSRREPRRREKKEDKKKPAASGKPAGGPSRPGAPRFTAKADAPVITLKPPIMVRELAEAINRKPSSSLQISCSSVCLPMSIRPLTNPPPNSFAPKTVSKFEAKKRQRDAGAPHLFRRRNSNSIPRTTRRISSRARQSSP